VPAEHPTKFALRRGELSVWSLRSNRESILTTFSISEGSTRHLRAEVRSKIRGYSQSRSRSDADGKPMRSRS